MHLFQVDIPGSRLASRLSVSLLYSFPSIAFQAHDMSPWQVCHTAHLPYLDSNLLPVDYSCADYAKQNPSRQTYGSSRNNHKRGSYHFTNRRDTDHTPTSERTPLSAHYRDTLMEPWEKTSDAMPTMSAQKHSAHHHLDRRSFTSSLGERSLSDWDRTQLTTKSGKAGSCSEGSTNGGRCCKGKMQPSGRKDKEIQPIPYRFRFHTDYHQYMEDYR